VDPSSSARAKARVPGWSSGKRFSIFEAVHLDVDVAQVDAATLEPQDLDADHLAVLIEVEKYTRRQLPARTGDGRPGPEPDLGRIGEPVDRDLHWHRHLFLHVVIKSKVFSVCRPTTVTDD
jgi:hypothetical protein